MPHWLDLFLVFGAVMGAALYLGVRWYTRRGAGSCCSGGAKSGPNHRLQIQLPNKSDR